MNIPLINTNDKESINTSLIAIKRATEELNNLIKIADEKMAQLDEKAKKYTDDKINALDVASVGGSGKYISAIKETDGKISATASDITSTVSSGNSQPVTSGGVAEAKLTKLLDMKELSVSGWYKIANLSARFFSFSVMIDLCTSFNYTDNGSHKVQINYGWQKAEVFDFAQDELTVFDKIRICYNSNNSDQMAIYVHYSPNVANYVFLNINACSVSLTPANFVTDSLTWENTIEYNLGSSGLYINGQSHNLIDSVTEGSMQPITSNAVYRKMENKISYDVKIINIGSSTEIPLFENTMGIIFFRNGENIYKSRCSIVSVAYGGMMKEDVLYDNNLNLSLSYNYSAGVLTVINNTGNLIIGWYISTQ